MDQAVAPGAHSGRPSGPRCGGGHSENEEGPNAAGATRIYCGSLRRRQSGPGGGPLRRSRTKAAPSRCRRSVCLLSLPGTDGKLSCGTGATRRRGNSPLRCAAGRRRPRSRADSGAHGPDPTPSLRAKRVLPCPQLRPRPGLSHGLKARPRTARRPGERRPRADRPSSEASSASRGG